MKQEAGKYYFLLVLTTLFWAGNTVASKYISMDVPPVALAFSRWALASVLIGLIARNKVLKDLPVIRQHWGILALLSFSGITCFNTLIYVALRTTTAINSLLLQSFFPVLVVLISYFFFAEKLKKIQVIGVLVSLSGTLFLVSKGRLDTLLSASFNPGDIWVVVAVVIYAIYTSLLRFRPAIHPQSFLVVTFFLGTLMLLPFLILESIFFEPMHLSGELLWVILYLVIFPSVLAYLFFNESVRALGANVTGLFLHLIPVFGSIMAVIFLKEQFYAYHAIGMLLILGGIGLVVMQQLTTQKKEEVV